MSRRCKAGQRARIICEGPNKGKIVLIVRAYFYPEFVADASWPYSMFGWTVTSLGAPLHSMYIETGESAPPSQSGVFEDDELEPLDDDDDAPSESEHTEVPNTRQGCTS